MNKGSSFHWPQMVGIKMSMTALFRRNMTHPSLKLRTMAIRNTSSANGMAVTAVLAALKAASFSWYSKKWRSNVSWRHENRVNLHVVNSWIPGSWEYLSINSCKASSNVRRPLYSRDFTSVLASMALIALRIMVSQACRVKGAMPLIFLGSFSSSSSSSSCASFAQLIESMPGARFYNPTGLFDPWMGLKGVSNPTQPNTLNSSRPPQFDIKAWEPKPNPVSRIPSTQLHRMTPLYSHSIPPTTIHPNPIPCPESHPPIPIQ